MKWLSKLRKLQMKRAFHIEYHRWVISELIIQGLNKLIEKEKDLINK